MLLTLLLLFPLSLLLLGFVFDIDGVLYRVGVGDSKVPIPGAGNTLKKLQGLGIPFMLV